MFRTISTSIFQNMGDAVAFVAAWIAYAVVKLAHLLADSDKLKDFPFIGRWLSRTSTHFVMWVEGHVFDLAAALTLGLLANLIWDILAARKHWKSPDPSKSTLVPAPGPLNWVVAAGSFLLFTKLRATGISIGDFFYWSSWWEIALAILLTILGVAAVVAIFAFIWRFWQSRRGAHTRRRRRRRRR